VTGHVDDVERFELNDEERAVPPTAATGGASPYRHGRRTRGLVVGSQPQQPVVLRCVSQA
jgi:hypothetical protein